MTVIEGVFTNPNATLSQRFCRCLEGDEEDETEDFLWPHFSWFVNEDDDLVLVCSSCGSQYMPTKEGEDDQP